MALRFATLAAALAALPGAAARIAPDPDALLVQMLEVLRPALGEVALPKITAIRRVGPLDFVLETEDGCVSMNLKG
jgi:hypothetical protein